MKPAVAGATDGLRIIEQFGRPLAIQDNAELQVLQTASKHVIFVAPLGPGRSEVRYGGASVVLLVSRQPLLATARLLLGLGCRSEAIITMRRRPSTGDDLLAPLGVAARYTVDDTKTVFAKWKPFCRSAVPATDATRRTPLPG